MANAKKTTKVELTEKVNEVPSQDISKILEMVQVMQEQLSSLQAENQKLKEDIENTHHLEIEESVIVDSVAPVVEVMDSTPSKIVVYHMQELMGNLGTVIKLTNAKRRPTKMGQRMTFNVDEFEELIDVYRNYFDKGILALDAAHLNYAEMYDLPIYDSKTKAQYNSKILKDVVSYNYEQLQKFYNNLSENNKNAFLTYWLGQVYEKKDGYYNMEKMRWLNTISNTQTFGAILTEMENAERRKVNTRIDADKI